MPPLMLTPVEDKPWVRESKDSLSNNTLGDGPMTWKMRLIGLSSAVAVIAALALASGLDVWD